MGKLISLWRILLLLVVADCCVGAEMTLGAQGDKDVKAYIASAKAWMGKKNYDSAIKDFTEALRLDRTNFDGLAGRAEARFFKKDHDGAINDYDELLRLHPNTPILYSLRGYVRLDKGTNDAAIKDFDEAIRLDRKDAGSFVGRARAWRNKKDFGKAVDDYTEAVRLNPKDIASCNAVAWLLATGPDAASRNGKKAVQFATKACELNGWKFSGYIDTLAAAHAEAGQFEEAVRYQKQALQDPRYKGPAGNALRQRLQLYEQKMTYHQMP
jgi:tetratricopeptide (TPR) repeat protein